MTADFRSKRPFTPALAVALALLLGGAAALIAGCDLAPFQPTSVPGAPTEPPSSLEPTAVSTGTASMTPAATLITLTIWTTEAFSPTEAITSGQILAQQVAEMEGTRPGMQLHFVLKKPHGKGGILDYLLTTQAVAPNLLPDVAIIDVDELGAAVQANLVQPLDDLIPGDLVDDLYPAAREACTFDGLLYGLQFQADLEHLVYNTGKMTIPPSSWPGVLSNPGPYIFPAGGQAGLVNDAFLIQYLAVHPQFVEGEPGGGLLDQDSVAAVLQYYQDGASTGIFPAAILGYHSTDDCWRDYLAGQAAITQVRAQQYLIDRRGLESSAPAPIPAINGPAAAIDRGWALALITADASREPAAVEFMLRIMAPETNAAWNLAANSLPTRQAALALWNQEDTYVPFIGQQLLAARPRPLVSNYTQVAAALQGAVESVLTGAAPPEEAAAAAVESIQ
jgi:ABC-type glycerol-3-phosphate transport system substrate-binding protein